MLALAGMLTVMAVGAGAVSVYLPVKAKQVSKTVYDGDTTTNKTVTTYKNTVLDGLRVRVAEYSSYDGAKKHLKNDGIYTYNQKGIAVSYYKTVHYGYDLTDSQNAYMGGPMTIKLDQYGRYTENTNQNGTETYSYKDKLSGKKLKSYTQITDNGDGKTVYAYYTSGSAKGQLKTVTSYTKIGKTFKKTYVSKYTYTMDQNKNVKTCVQKDVSYSYNSKGKVEDTSTQTSKITYQYKKYTLK